VSTEKEIAVHLSPVWRDKANFLIHADLSSVGLPSKWEQLWARQLDDGRYELCCIPFFAPALALADQVDVARKDGKEHVVHSVITGSGRVAARVAFVNDAESDKVARQLIDEMRAANCLFEWYTTRYLAIDIADRSAFQHMNKVLTDHASAGKVKYEFSKQGVFEH
jgi:Domain of unknown function (DUF4265)